MSTATKVKNQALGWVNKSVKGRRQSYNTIIEEKLKKMMEVNFQQRTEAEIKWAFNFYNDWHTMKVDQIECEREILYADLNDIGSLTKENLEFALCRFICEIKKANGEDYPGHTLYQLACSLQNYLQKKELNWRLIHSSDFPNFQGVLDNVTQERSAQCIGNICKQAQVISMDYENRLWKQSLLGEDTPDKLRNMVLYLLGINLALRAGDEHYALRHPGGCTLSQLSFETNTLNQKCLVYREDTVTKTNRDGFRVMKKARKIVWIKPNSNFQRCPVCFVEKYLNLIPYGGVKGNLYVQSLRKPKPSVWYSTTPVGINKIRSVVGSLLKDAGLDGYFTNHSLHRTCTTCLFQVGQSSKLVKEITGHISDAVNKYQMSSESKRWMLVQ